MPSRRIVREVRQELNKAGEKWTLRFKVSDEVQADGAWLQVFIHNDATKVNAVVERQIIADVGSDLSDKCGQELLLVPVQDLITSGA